ncbi:hypothetical protein [Pseudomonas aeruginosa]|uniref:hypothetical protein n=1 Tax=Pseudomonas aeruginosa TaxID=287 RepID=UPI0021B3F8CB|nr:hypothetical protein [Pseudomonas aeruginosa]MCT7418381.1 hypothetical protein [Pseudomonas aeruginosa]
MIMIPLVGNYCMTGFCSSLNQSRQVMDQAEDLLAKRPGWRTCADKLPGLTVPDFFAQAGNAFQSIPPSVVYFANAFQIGPGVTMVWTPGCDSSSGVSRLSVEVMYGD